MNLQFRPPDRQRQVVQDTGTIVAADRASGIIATQIDVRGFQWITYTFDLTSQGSVVNLAVEVEMTDIDTPLVDADWWQVPVEDVNATTGSAPQAIYQPNIPVSAAGKFTVTVPVNAALKSRVRVWEPGGNVAASLLEVYALRS